MGLDQSIYVGIYFVCRPKTKDEIMYGEVCPNDHPIKIGQKYCAECGEKLVMIGLHTPKLIRWYEISNILYHGSELNNTLMQMCGERSHNIDILVPNQDKWEYGTFLRSSEIKTYNYSNVDIAHQKDKFMQEYKEILDFLRPLYVSIDIEWGIVVDWR